MNINDINREKYTEFYSMKELVRSMKMNPMVWSWGAHNWTNLGNKFLVFQVNGHHHKGFVMIGVNGLDLFDIYLITPKKEVKETIENIYLEDLLEVVDKKVEYISDYVR